MLWNKLLRKNTTKDLSHDAWRQKIRRQVEAYPSIFEEGEDAGPSVPASASAESASSASEPEPDDFTKFIRAVAKEEADTGKLPETNWFGGPGIYMSVFQRLFAEFPHPHKLAVIVTSSYDLMDKNPDFASGEEFLMKIAKEATKIVNSNAYRSQNTTVSENTRLRWQSA